MKKKSKSGLSLPKELPGSSDGINEDRQKHLEEQTREIRSKLKRLASAAKYRRKNLKALRQKQREAWRRKHPNGVGRGRWRKPKVVINDFGEVYLSAAEAAAVFKVDKNAIYIAIQNPNRICARHRWAYAKSGIPKQWDKPADLTMYSQKRRFHERRRTNTSAA